MCSTIYAHLKFDKLKQKYSCLNHKPFCYRTDPAREYFLSFVNYFYKQNIQKRFYFVICWHLKYVKYVFLERKFFWGMYLSPRFGVIYIFLRIWVSRGKAGCHGQHLYKMLWNGRLVAHARRKNMWHGKETILAHGRLPSWALNIMLWFNLDFRKVKPRWRWLKG